MKNIGCVRHSRPRASKRQSIKVASERCYAAGLIFMTKRRKPSPLIIVGVFALIRCGIFYSGRISDICFQALSPSRRFFSVRSQRISSSILSSEAARLPKMESNNRPRVLRCSSSQWRSLIRSPLAKPRGSLADSIRIPSSQMGTKPQNQGAVHQVREKSGRIP